MNATEVADRMGLHSIHNRNWYIHPTCGTTGEGLYEGLEWLRSQYLGKKYNPSKAAELI